MGKKSRKPKQKAKEGGVVPSAASGSGLGNGPPPPPTGASCWICLDSGSDDGGKPIVRDCSCRGDNAGFAHLSCLAKYSETKTIDELKKGAAGDLHDIMEFWDKCPQCCQNYQRQVALDMAKSFLASDISQSEDISRICGFNLLLNTIAGLDYEGDPALREEGKRAANQMISLIQRDRGNMFAEMHLEVAYMSLARFSEAENTKDGYGMTILYYEKLRDFHKSRGDLGNKVKEINSRIERVKSMRDGEGLKNLDIDKEVKMSRVRYAQDVKQYGEKSSETFASASKLLGHLYGSGLHGLENERLANKLFTISRQVHGPQHPTTKKFQVWLERCKRREVGIKSAGTIREWQVLRYSEDEGKYIIKGPISHPRVEEEEIRKVTINDFMMSEGTPVTCHGLKNASHLNGKVGDIGSWDDKSCHRYQVRFEDKNHKSALVKKENLRIILELPALELT